MENHQSNFPALSKKSWNCGTKYGVANMWRSAHECQRFTLFELR